MHSMDGNRCSMTDDEEIIDSLFLQCDAEQEGTVQVSTVIEYLRTCLGVDNDQDLSGLASILEEDGVNGRVDFSSYKEGVRKWIADIRNRSSCEDFPPVESEILSPEKSTQPDPDISATSSQLTSGFMETSGMGDGLYHHTEHDINELQGRLEDLKYQNRKLTEENNKLHLQLDNQEDNASTLNADISALRKKNKSLQELVEFRQELMEENQELKTKIATLQEKKKELEHKLSMLERESMNLANLNRSLENKFQKSVVELEKLQKDCQYLQSSFTEQRHLLTQEQEEKASREIQLQEKSSEITNLKERVKELLYTVEKQKEEKDEVQGQFTQVLDKLHRLQSRVEHLGLEHVPGYELGGPERLDNNKISPKLQFSTPLTRHSICMELKDRLEEDKHLPSPFCEKLELSDNVSLYTRRPLLPMYMSAWEMDSSNSSYSLGDHSLDQVKHIRLSDPFLADIDGDNRLAVLKNWGRDALQNEVLRLYRVNLDLAEKCHKAELKQHELQEAATVEKDKCSELQENLTWNRSAREDDLRDLWRLVQKEVEVECMDTDSSASGSGSTEFLKEQIAQEIENLKTRLKKREFALGALTGKPKPRRCQHHCEGTKLSSTLLEALAIDYLTLKQSNKNGSKSGKLRNSQGVCRECQRSQDCSFLYTNKSVPLTRRNNVRADNSKQIDLSNSSSTSGVVDLEARPGRPLGYTDKDKNAVTNRLQFCEDDSQTSQSIESNTTDNDTSLIPQRPCQAGVDSDKDLDDLDGGSSDNSGNHDGLMLRRPSYTAAIENQSSSVEEVHIARNRSFSFQSAIEQGQISPTRSSNLKVDLVCNSSLDNQNPESSWNIPCYSSTPLPQSKTCSKVVNFHLRKCEPLPGEAFKPSSSNSSGNQSDIIFRCSGDTDQSQDLGNSLSMAIPTASVSKRPSPCTARRLSVLVEEDGATEDNLTPRIKSHQSPPPYTSVRKSSSLSGPSGRGSQSIEEQSPKLECSAEVWTLSGTRSDSGHSSNSGSSCFDSILPSADSSVNSTGSQYTGDQASVSSAGSQSPGEQTTHSSVGSQLKQISSKHSLQSSAADKSKIFSSSFPGCSSSGAFQAEIEGGEPIVMKGPAVMVKDEEQSTLPSRLTPPSRSQQGLSPGEKKDELTSLTTSPQQSSSPFLSRIRENHLARRRDQMRHMKMPQLSELSEKDNSVAEENGLSEENSSKEPKDNGTIQPPEPNGDAVLPSIPKEFLEKLGLSSDGPSPDELSDQEIESKFASLSLAFKTDSQTLEKRLEIQERSRDISEQNVDKEIQGLRAGLETLNQLCTDPQVREVLAKIQHHIDILEKSTARVSSRAEVFGAIQQEKRMSKAVDIMVHHVENLRRVHEREHAELEEARKLLQDSRSLGPTSLDLSGDSVLMRRSVSVCPNNMMVGGRVPQSPGSPSLGVMSPSIAKAIRGFKPSRRRVSEIALPKIMGGTGSPNLHPSSSMDSSSFFPELRSPRSPLRSDSSVSDEEASNLVSHLDLDTSSSNVSQKTDKDPRTRFQAVVASATVKSAVANTLRRASLEKQNNSSSQQLSTTSSQTSSQPNTPSPSVSRNNSQDKPVIDQQEKEKQKNLEEEAYKKGYEQGLRASLGQDLSSLREQQNSINESLGDIMDSIDNHMDEQKSLKEVMLERLNSSIPKIKISGWRIRMTMGCFVFMMAIVSVIVSLFPVGSAELVNYRYFNSPPV